jgi:hypothetical protein
MLHEAVVAQLVVASCSGLTAVGESKKQESDQIAIIGHEPPTTAGAHSSFVIRHSSFPGAHCCPIQLLQVIRLSAVRIRSPVIGS